MFHQVNAITVAVHISHQVADDPVIPCRLGEQDRILRKLVARTLEAKTERLSRIIIVIPL